MTILLNIKSLIRYSINRITSTEYLPSVAAIKSKKFSVQSIKVLALIVIFCVLSTMGFAQTFTFSSSNPSVPATNILQSATTQQIYRAVVVVSGGGGANFTKLTFTPSGTFIPADINTTYNNFGYRVWASTTDNLSGAASISNLFPPQPTGSPVTITINSPYWTSGTTYYLWITADISPTAIAGHTLTVGALTTGNFTFSGGTKSGTMYVGGTQTIALKQFRSIANGNWNATTTWQQSADGTNWVAATTTPTSADGLVTIQNAHTVTVTANATASNLVVNGAVIVNGNNTLTPTTATINGTVTVQGNGTAQVVNGTGAITFNAGSTYNHGVNGGAIPTATWNLTSTCNITGYTNEAGGTTTPTSFQASLNQSFGNFNWNSTSQTYDYSFGGQFLIVNGNLTVTSTGTGSVTLGNSGTGDLSVGGNFVQSGGQFFISASGARAMSVAKNFSISGGVFDLSSSSTAANYTTLNVGGNFNFTGGTITESGSTTASVINFNGTNNQTFTSGGTLSNIVNFSILPGAIVDFGTSVISSGSTGSFTLNPGGSIITANTNATGALTTTGANGTIQLTGTRTYNSGANYTFNGTAAQVTGNGLFQNNPGIVTISNSFGVTFSGATAMNYLVINSGSTANLGTFANTASLLFLGPDTYSSGVYGGTGSTGPSVIINATYFKPNTGYITVTNTVVQPISTTSNFTAPCGVTSVIVEVWGGGGAGGKRTSSGNSGGGGGGAYSKATLSVIPGTNYIVSIGGGSSSSAAGGDTWFGTSLASALVLAKGGNSVADNSSTGAIGGATTTGIGTTKFSGGSGAAGSGSGPTGYSGGGGSSAGTSANGNNGIAGANTGGTAPAGGGNGGNGASGSNGSGVNGLAPGGGGGGAYRTSIGTSVGGSGANGQARITYIPVTPSITLGANPSVCQGITSATISYTSNAGCPDQYSIDFSAAAIVAGFVNVPFASLPAGSITILVPSNAASGTYSGTLKVRNSGTSTPSGGYTISITVTSNIWTGTISSAWDNVGNWCGGIPTATTDVIIPSGVTQPVITAAVSGNCKSISINSGANITIYGSLNVATNITNNAGVSGIVVKSSSSVPNGTLIFQNPVSLPVNATVEMYSLAEAIDKLTPSNFKWQYFGIPVSTVTASPTFDGSYVRSWDETQPAATHWHQLNNASVLSPFIGYEITQLNATTILFKGQLVNSNFTAAQSDLTITTGAGFPGQHIYANPYTAAIDIRNLSFGSADPAVIENSIYLYSTGSLAQWTSQGGVSNTIGTPNPGQYTVISTSTAGNLGIPRQIPPMQAMLVIAHSSTPATTFGFSYNSVVVKDTTLQRAPGVKGLSETGDLVGTLIEVVGSRTSDRMWLFSNPACTRNFDNGWDGTKLFGTVLSPQIFAEENDGNYQIDAVDDINDTKIGFQAGEDINYTFTFTHQNLASKYAGVYLVDSVENKIVDITESGSTYSFVAESTPTTVNRFKIVTRNYEKNAPDATTQIKVFSAGNTVFVQNLSNLNGDVIIYDIVGHCIKRTTFGPNGVTSIPVSYVSGAYIVSASTMDEKVGKRVIIKN
ncbi:MAG: hypothetical protein P4L34_08420 [Paludibacter sp.]|nr:hypothetical protein [Paludibacter sp.]